MSKDKNVLHTSIIGDVSRWGTNARGFIRETKNFKGSKLIVPVNSYGGSVTEAVAIHNYLASQVKRKKYKVEAHIVGIALSAGSFIPAAANEVHTPSDAIWMITLLYWVT